MIRIVINDVEEVHEPLTLQKLVQQKDLPPDRVVVELNETIITRTLWGKTSLKDGDRLELVRFVGGG